MKNKLLAYAVDFASFLLERVKVDYIKSIILFGFVARGEASNKSDIDIFVDVAGPINKEVKRVKADFLKSKRYNDYWLLKGVKNKLNIIVGKLDEWQELKNSIISNGIVLYGKFEETPKKGVHKCVFSWENVKPEPNRVLLSKRLFGYKKGKKNYEGLVDKYKGERIGKGTISMPLTSSNVFLKLFRNMKIPVKIRKIIEYK